jgi:hypothetical protein
VADVFDPGAIDANKAGRLADDQRKWLRNLSSGSRRGSLTAALVCAVLGLLLIFAAGPPQYAVTKPLLGFGFMVVAGFLFVRGILGADALTEDLRDRKVDVVEGAISKRRVSTGGRSSRVTHYIDVEGECLEAFHDQYEAAPDAGWVRVYYLPHSHRVVNFERLPDKPLPAGAFDSPQAAMKAAAGAVHGSEAARAEAMAQLQAMGAAMRATVAGDATPPPPDQRDSRPLAEAIVGSWTNGFVTIDFNSDGTATGSAAGRHHDGHWSVDSSGKLVADVMGHSQAVDAWVTADGLTIADNGSAMKFSRA